MIKKTAKQDLIFQLRSNTKSLHREVEASGVVRNLLTGNAKLADYVSYIRNLAHIYLTMEEALRAHHNNPGIKDLVHDELFRYQALSQDLVRLAGVDWLEELPVLQASRDYEDQIKLVSAGGGLNLAAHAYVRYLGDLNGGQILSKILQKSLSLTPAQLGFYQFSGISDLSEFKLKFQRAIIRCGEIADEPNDIVEEAQRAFRLNIKLSVAVASNSA